MVILPNAPPENMLNIPKTPLLALSTISANATEELLTHPLVITEGEVIKATAASGNRLHIVFSVLQITRD